MARYNFFLPYRISVIRSLESFTKSPKALSLTVKELAIYGKATDKEKHKNITF